MKIVIGFLIDFLISFIAIFVCYLLLLKIKPIRKKKVSKINENEMNIIINRYQLDKEVLGEKYLKRVIALLNSFVFAFTLTIMEHIDKFIYKILVCFVVLMILIYSVYEIAGKYLKRKEEKKKCTTQKKLKKNGKNIG